LLPLTADPEAEVAKITSVEQAEQMLAQSAAWLRENAGEERFVVFRYLTHIAAVDGTLRGREEAFVLHAAEMLGIPTKAAKETLYRSLAARLATHRSERSPMASLK